MIEFNNTIVVIPARMASLRLPGKPLADIHGIPMIVHVWRRAVEANIGKVLVAQPKRIADVVRSHGGVPWPPTPFPRAPTGSRPSASVTPGKLLPSSICRGTCRQLIPGSQRCLAGLTNDSVEIATIAALIEADADVRNPNVVKAIAPLGEGREVAYARDFVRDVGPEHDAPFWRHIGVYAYRREALDRFASLPVSTREARRKLEQMRALDNDMRMAVVRVDSVPLSVSAPADLEAARLLLRKKP
jgi:3-deoxy-manno-octulosonate cytidylyltransferase (CMP-KDO synthetase)